MISSAIWNGIWNLNKHKYFSKTTKNICYLSLKNLRVLIYSKLHEKNHLITCFLSNRPQVSMGYLVNKPLQAAGMSADNVRG